MRHANVIVVRGLGIRYDLRLRRDRTIKGIVAETVSRAVRGRGQDDEGPKQTEFWALEDVTFALREGEILGVVGRNGSGKSTLLLTLAGILQPDKGSVSTAGRTVTLLTVGAGFEPRLSGRENIYLNGAYLGLTQRRMDDLINQIIDFSELGEFIDAPMKTYSSGMRARLGFSVAAFVEPDILLLDEVLGVGDAPFQRKSREKMEGLMERAFALVVVSHSSDFVRETCTKALWLDDGKSVAFGEPDEIVHRYLEHTRATRGPVRTITQSPMS